ncbi:MAG: tRNA uridine(34) 5-carboxymethylaminomethyl modification radical SAM/GNAT enzyme Elp3 [Candidatus Hodarchaeota archaeon]
MRRVSQEILQAVLAGQIRSKDDLQRMKRKLCRKYKLSRFPSDVEILGYASEDEKQKVNALLRKKPTRSLSGVVIVAVMTEPMKCPGQCIYCPTNLPTAPKAYVGEEPATLRAQQNQYDPYLQVKSRLEQLQAMGHSTEKVELIVMGGTFLSAPPDYQINFVKRSLDAMIGSDTKTLTEAIQLAERSVTRPVGITIETRPDYCQREHIDSMLAFGTTRVELGVQTIYDDIYSKVSRGHKVSDVIAATQAAKDAGLKVCYHVMPGLPGSTPKRDKQVFKDLFQRSEFCPDMLKIYPCLVLRGSDLFDMWRKGEYEPYTTEEIVDLLADITPFLPPWVRIQRMQRDIPKHLIVAGPNAGNLTQLVFQQAEEKGYELQTIRRREVGYKQRSSQEILHDAPNIKNLELQVTEYSASNGTELFIAFDDIESDTLIGYLRLRLPSNDAHRSEINSYDSALIRELHVYGLSVDLGKLQDEAWQHRGVGSKLLSIAENLALEKGRNHMVCTSGIGVRQYYKRHGYQHDGPYMAKQL